MTIVGPSEGELAEATLATSGTTPPNATTDPATAPRRDWADSIWRRYYPTSATISVAISLVVTPVLSLRWFAPVITAMIVFLTAAGVTAIVWVLRRRRALMWASVVPAAVVLSAVAGLILMPPRDFGVLGPVICVPIGAVAVTLGLGVDALIWRFRRLGPVLSVLGSVALAVCVVVSALADN